MKYGWNTYKSFPHTYRYVPIVGGLFFEGVYEVTTSPPHVNVNNPILNSHILRHRVL